MAYIDDFRALASIAISKDVSDKTKQRAEKLLDQMMDLIEKSTEIETFQTDEFLRKIKGKIEVVNQ